MRCYVAFFLIIICMMYAYSNENGSSVAVYSINGVYIGTMNVSQALHSSQVQAILSPMQILYQGKQHTLARGIYFLAPTSNIPPGESFSSLAGFGFDDATADFLPQEQLEAGDIKTADINGDNLQDIVFSIHNYLCDTTVDTRPRVWLQEPDGKFIDATDSLIPNIHTPTYSLLLFDADGDGDIDIFLGGGCEDVNKCTLLINDGQGHFSDESEARLPTMGGIYFVQQAASGKIDNNISNDLVVTVIGDFAVGSSNFYCPELWLNDGSGFFHRDTLDRLPDSVQYGYYNVSIGDINKDSLNDILFANMEFVIITNAGPEILRDTAIGKTALFINHGDGYFHDETATRIPDPDNKQIRKITLADVDDDGNLDILELGMLWSTYIHQNRLLRNDGTGNFLVWNGALPDSLSGWFNDAEFGLFNDDSYPDIFLPKVMPGLQDYDVLLLNNGNGTFSDSSILLPHTLDFTASANILDHQSDGDPDIVCANTGDSITVPGQNTLYKNLLYNVLGIKDNPDREPGLFALYQAFPNPFNPVTTIRYALATSGYVTIKVYDLLGREAATLVNGIESAGDKSVTFNANNLPGGIYYYRLQTESYSNAKKIVLMR